MKPSAASLNWTPSAALLAFSERGDDRKLSLTIFAVGCRWHVISLETPTQPASPEDVLDNHAHKVVGDYDTPILAITAAESFAEAWRTGRFAEIPQCMCDEIEPPKRLKRAR